MTMPGTEASGFKEELECTLSLAAEEENGTILCS